MKSVTVMNLMILPKLKLSSKRRRRGVDKGMDSQLSSSFHESSSAAIAASSECSTQNRSYKFNSVSFCSISSTEELTSTYCSRSTRSACGPPPPAVDFDASTLSSFGSPRTRHRYRAKKSVSFAASVSFITPSRLKLDEKVISDLWYTSSQIQMLNEINDMNISYFVQKEEEQCRRNLQGDLCRQEDEEDDPMFCRTGLDYSLSPSRKERSQRCRSMILNSFHQDPDQMRQVSRDLSKEAVSDALAEAGKVRAEL